MDLLDLFVLNIPFESLQQMEFKTKMAKSLLFDPAETLRRNKANNEGVDMCRESLQLPGKRGAWWWWWSSSSSPPPPPSSSMSLLLLLLLSPLLVPIGWACLWQFVL